MWKKLSSFLSETQMLMIFFQVTNFCSNSDSLAVDKLLAVV